MDGGGRKIGVISLKVILSVLLALVGIAVGMYIAQQVQGRYRGSSLAYVWLIPPVCAVWFSTPMVWRLVAVLAGISAGSIVWGASFFLEDHGIVGMLRSGSAVVAAAITIEILRRKRAVAA